MLSILLYVGATFIFLGSVITLFGLNGKTVRPVPFMWFLTSQVFLVTVMILAARKLGGF